MNNVGISVTEHTTMVSIIDVGITMHTFPTILPSMLNDLLMSCLIIPSILPNHSVIKNRAGRFRRTQENPVSRYSTLSRLISARYQQVA